MTFVASKTDPPYEVWCGPDPLGALVAMARTDAQRMAGGDVKRTSQTASVDGTVGGKRTFKEILPTLERDVRSS